MSKAAINHNSKSRSLPKAPTGIQGLDEITGGGLPRGRPTLVCGSAGCGKTLFAMEFLVRGATEFGEPGVFMAFEETAEELAQNVRSLGFDLDELAARRNCSSTTSTSSAARSRRPASTTSKACSSAWAMRSTRSAPSASCSTRSRRSSAACPTPPSCAPSCAGCSAGSRTRGVTAVITGERGDATLTRQGLEEYVSDCVIVLDHRVTEQLSTRRLRIVKYRGTTHGTNEYPFLIDENGISVLPITSMGLRAQRRPTSGSPPASPGSTTCSAARGSIAAAAC